MSRENVTRLHRAVDAFNRRDLAAFLALMDEDVEHVPRAVAIEGGSYHGHDGIRRWWEDQLDIFPDYISEVGEVRDSGDLTLAALRLRGRGAGSDIPSDALVWQIIRWRHGKCIWWGTFGTEAEALAAVRLSE